VFTHEDLLLTVAVAVVVVVMRQVDMSAIMALRNKYKDAFEKKHGVKLGFMSAFIKASAASLKEIPAVNAGTCAPHVSSVIHSTSAARAF
jgi:pyruvate/2-oxoglutarate dehydrogenase complex dihydrolipoamide acyltransferase (E2) component